jgi:hypothetical protein
MIAGKKGGHIITIGSVNSFMSETQRVALFLST